MAKKENTEDLQGGLTAGLKFSASREVKNMGDKTNPAEPAAENNKNENDSLSEMYQGTMQLQNEKRSYRFNILIRPSLAKKMEQAAAEGKIKSRNDLINFLLERYFDELGYKGK